ncbi:MAG: UbiA prenyltransferase family protein [Pyrinomonadaceae bacterium]|nr:UbiA prenyltransferase family protein [Sphingobacteriaceae bacterium]
MYLKTVYIFLLSLAGCLTVSTASATVLLQDTVKKVYIKVLASEKPKFATMESLENDAVSKKPENITPTKPTYTKSRASLKRGGPAFNTISKPAGVTKIAPKRLNPVSNPSKIVVNKTPVKSAQPNPNIAARDKPSNLNTQQEIHNEVENAQVIDIDDTETQVSNIKTSKTYLWVGIVLVVVGMILGILFGKTALLISIAGMVFVIIGYTITS